MLRGELVGVQGVQRVGSNGRHWEIRKIRTWQLFE